MVNTKKILGIASFRIINSFRNGINSSFMGIYLRENLALSVTESNLLFTLLEMIGALGQFFVWGYIADRYNARNSLIIIGETIPATGYIGIFYLHRYLLQTGGTHSAGLSIVFGISALEFFWGAGFVGFYSLLSDIPETRIRSKYLGYTITLQSIGYIGGTFIGGLLFDYKYPGGGFGEGILFFVLAPMIFGFAFLSWITRKETEPRDQKEDPDLDSISENIIIPQGEQDKIKETIPQLRIFYWFLIGLMISAIGKGAVRQIALFYLRLPESIAISAFAVSLLITARWIGHLVSGLIASKFSGRSARIGYLATIAWYAIFPLFFPFVNSFFIVLLLYTSEGIIMGVNTVTAFSIISDIIPVKRRAVLLSQYNASRMVASGSGGSLIGGPIADWQLGKGATLASAYTFTFSTNFFMGLGAMFLTLWKAKPAIQIPNKTTE